MAHLSQGHVPVDVDLVFRQGTAQQGLVLCVRHAGHLSGLVVGQLQPGIGVRGMGALHRHHGGEPDVGTGGTYQQLVAASLHLPSVGLDVPVAERLVIQRDGDGLALSGFQLHLEKAL